MEKERSEKRSNSQLRGVIFKKMSVRCHSFKKMSVSEYQGVCIMNGTEYKKSGILQRNTSRGDYRGVV